ncbi:SUR7/PalI family-domain-containing protein [Apiospora kogelbergensis]|uniref:SUR7/PalI family-domain-containing protein n=1 Tax=Apiospora kogelbergensis TaxID=1337665 RepID=UPI003131C7A6
MLRPATPLTILLFAAFALLVLSILSTPIIKAIPLGTFKGTSFGVFGWCRGDTCSGIEIGYDASAIEAAKSGDFDLPNSARSTLSAILIIHPVAALFTLIMLIMAGIAHMHSPSHSSRYLLALFIFGILTFLVCLLAFLIDVLLFVPHMAWGSYIVLASTILVALSGLVSCAMRRTVVSRKARKKRIAENAEMSGENYYNRNAQQSIPTTSAPSMQPTVPVVSGANGPSDKLPSFATYEKKDDRSSDERIPLTSTSPSQRSPNNAPVDMHAPPNAVYGGGPQRSASNQSLPRDQYGNPMQPPQGAYGVRRGPSQERMNSRGRGGGPPPAGARGRGGYGRGGYAYGPPQGTGGRGGYGGSQRGGYAPGPNGRGGYGPPRGGYGAGMRGGRGPPPPNYGGNGSFDRRPSPGDPYGAYGPARNGSPAPRVPYGANQPMPNVPVGNAGTGSYEAYNPDRVSELPRAESPPPLPGTDKETSGPVGRAVEMDATTGSPAHAPAGFGQFNGIRDSDADVAGMLALQQARVQRHDTYMSEASRYSQDESYTPPRQAWNQGTGRNSPRMPSPLNVAPKAADLPSRTPPPPAPAASDSNYYEDVDPRFTETPPRALQTGPAPPLRDPMREPSYDDDMHAAAGAKSPAPSERSTFTSISQRGINPRYQPPVPPGGYGQAPPRRPVNQQNGVDVLNNPDFQLGPARKPGGGMLPGSAYPGL